MALAGSQQVHLAATVDGENPASQSPFPPCSIINSSNPFPISPSPVYTLLTQNIIGGPYPYSSAGVPKGLCAIDVQYMTGSVRQQSTIIVQEAYATVIAAL